ncbi:hypothetical protein Pst134EA_024410 [Puccinia striiformis f. sp. tritici]|uniref:hypothetical protein n=1 Tax=Puccinia striiformis f. sp. tritici TaxID=168172 RepID=UPI002007398B|nr:hypothetical protein Pst134EA_024410 [Puccinia striiformis f. sp. tritici]KAH9453540.1 hypothetical protein Pst134EA_024410 [Puccinia striiformis f. sp. tritici]
MANNLQAYLASKYMSGPKAEAILASRIDGGTKKKSKKKSSHKVSSNETNSHQEPGSHSGMILKDVDGDDQWISRDDELDGAPGESFHTAEHEFQSQVLSRNQSNIIVVQTEALSQAKWKSINDEIDNEPEDGRLQTAALEQAKLKSGDNEIDDEPSNSNKVVDGGLQTAASLQAKLAKSKAPLPPTQQFSEEDEPIEEETIYRDSQGKKIDTKQLRAEEKRKQARELEKKMKKMEWGKGLVQRQDRKTDADELKKIASQPFARTIDDKEMNDEMKGTQQWNDPAAGFLTVVIHHAH